jgi:hypothetical protein
MTTIKDKYPTFTSFWNEYRKEFFDNNKDLVTRSIAVSLCQINYNYWGQSSYEPEEGVFYGKFFGKLTTDIIRNSQSQEIYANVFKLIKLKDKELFKSGSKIEHSRINERIKENPQITEQTNIPYTQGEDMISDTYGRAQILKQKKAELRETTKEITKGRRVKNEDGSIEFKPTYDETTSWGEKSWLGKLLSALQYIKFDFEPQSYSFLFVKLFGAKGYLITLPSGRKKWISTALYEEEEEETPILPKKKKVDDIGEITWEEWKEICAKQTPPVIPTQQNYYLECITRYYKRKEKEKAPPGTLSALALDKQKELADGLITAWSKDLTIPQLEKFDRIMNKVVGYTEFKDKMRMYIVNLAKDIKEGKKTEQTIYVLLGPPGIGKSYITEMMAEAMDRVLINIDLGGRSDTTILEGVSPSTKAPFAGRICQGVATGKDRGAIILLDEFEKVRDIGLANMLGNVLDIKKNKDWMDQFLGYRIDLSDCIIMCTANYADQVPDFVQDRAEMVNIELATYEQRVQYVMNSLKKKLRSDTDIAFYADQLNEDFCKYIICEAWGYRQTNANMETIYKTLRGYDSEEINKPITNLVNFVQMKETNNRFSFIYEQGQKLTLNRVRTENEQGQSVFSPELGLNWPNHGFIKPKVIVTK